MMSNNLDSTARLTRKSRYLVSLMKDQMPDHKLKRAIKILDQCIFAIRFYEKTGQDKYIDELSWAVKRLHQLFGEKGVQSD